MLFMVTVFGQTLTREDYLLKSKRQKTTGHILSGAGGLMFAGGLLINVDDETAITLMGIGLLTELVSGGFYLSSHINERKAAKLSVSYQHVSIPRNNGQAFHRQPTLTLSIPIR